MRSFLSTLLGFSAVGFAAGALLGDSAATVIAFGAMAGSLGLLLRFENADARDAGLRSRAGLRRAPAWARLAVIPPLAAAVLGYRPDADELWFYGALVPLLFAGTAGVDGWWRRRSVAS